MNNKKSRWVFFVCLISVLLILVSCNKQSPGLTERDQANIYAAVIRQIYTIDHTYGIGNSPNFPVVYLPRATDDGAGDAFLSDANSSVLSESLQVLIISNLKGLLAKFIWVDNRNAVPMEKDVVAGNGAIINFGNIYLQKDGSVQVAGGLYIAITGGGGMTYILECVNGAWTITGNTGKVWIS